MTLEQPKIFKILLLGDAGVGKTNILKKYVKNQFTEKYKPTICLDFLEKEFNIDNHSIKLQIWEMPGEKRYQSVSPTFFEKTNCCILVYDVSNPSTFENICNWKNEFLECSHVLNINEFPFILLANKIDLKDHQISTKIANEFAHQNNMEFFEISAKTNNEKDMQIIFETAYKKSNS